MIFWEPISLKNEYEKIKVNATTYNEWKEAAEALDDLEGNEEWKQSPVSSDYDYELIHNRLIQLRKARELNDVNAIAFLLRTSKPSPMSLREICSQYLSSNMLPAPDSSFLASGRHHT